MVNLETGIMQRKERGAVETKKKAPPVRMGSRLLSHLRRWKRLDPKGTVYIVNFRGKRILRPCSSWERVMRDTGLPAYVTPHVLRHSRATTMLKAGVAPWEVANALGMSLQVLISTYGHHHPDWQKDAAEAR
jgi:integrase